MPKKVFVLKCALALGFTVMLILSAGYCTSASATDTINRWELSKYYTFSFSAGSNVIRSEDLFFTSANASIEIIREVDHIYSVVFDIYPISESRSNANYGTPCLTMYLDTEVHYIRANFTTQPTEYIIRAKCNVTIPNGVTMNVFMNCFSLYPSDSQNITTVNYNTENKNNTNNVYTTVHERAVVTWADTGLIAMICATVIGVVLLRRRR